MTSNPFLQLNFEPAFESLGEEYYDIVPAAEFPEHHLRFRNDRLLPLLGLDPNAVEDDHFIDAFGKFQSATPFLAMRYHGYQFGEYNPFLGDGRGFLYGQVWGTDGKLYDLGTKGSGPTPYSRGGDGRLTLKGGVREVLAAEALHELGVRTSRCLSLVETGEQLWRGDEPSPTRSSVMVRFSSSHIRFGTFERLRYIQRPDLIQTLLDRVIEWYYPHLVPYSDRYVRFYFELVERVAELAAQWMVAGFCHAVLNTDNMSITGESFDYGPYAFIPTYDLKYTAAYFDYSRRYCYRNQPGICHLNLQMLHAPLASSIPITELEAGLATFSEVYRRTYRHLMLARLGFSDTTPPEKADELIAATIALLETSQVPYHGFFATLAREFNPSWRESASVVMENAPFPELDSAKTPFETWQGLYHCQLNCLPLAAMDAIADRLRASNPQTALLRPEIEAVWQAIDEEDNWQPFAELLQKIRDRE